MYRRGKTAVDHTFLGLAAECTESFRCISCGEGGAAAEGDMLQPCRTNVLVTGKCGLVSFTLWAAQPTRSVTRVTCDASDADIALALGVSMH